MVLPRGRLAGAVVAVVPKLAGGALTLVLGLVMAARAEPADYGVYAYAVTLVLLAEAVIGTPFDLATIRLVQAIIAEQPERAVAIERQAVAMKATVALSAAVLLVGGLGLAPAGLTPLSGAPAILAATAAAALGLLAMGSMLLHLQMRERFLDYGRAEGAHVLLRFLPAFALVAAGDPAPAALVAALALGSILATGLALLRACRPLARIARSTGEWRGLFASVRWYMPTLALGAVVARLDLLALGALVPPGALGAYAAAATLAAVPDMLGMYLSIVLMPRIVARARDGVLRPFLVRTQAALCVAALLGGAAAAAFLASPLAGTMPGSLGAALPLFAILVPGGLVAMTTVPLALPFVMLVRRRFLLGIDLVVAPLALLAFVLVVPQAGTGGAACVALAVTLVRSLTVQAMAWRLSRARHVFGAAAAPAAAPA